MPNLNGWRDVQRRIKNIDGRVLRRNAKNIELRAEIDVHVISGRLKKSIRTEKISGGGRKIQGYRIIAGTNEEGDRENAYYAAYEERGTRFREGHPYMWPALVAERGRLRNLDLNPYLAGGSFFTSRGLR